MYGKNGNTVIDWPEKALPAGYVEITQQEYMQFIESMSQAAVPAESRESEIRRRLLAVDSEGARPAREVALALLSGNDPPLAAVTKLNELENEAQALRDELAALAA
jgi:hypothetical protein